MLYCFILLTDAEVVKPSNGYKWELAKLQFQMIDAIYTHVHNHLLRTHFKMEPACVTLERHLSYYHPLHQILKFHCRGTLAVNINAVPSLLGPQRLFDQLTAIGRIGLTKIFNDGYLKMHWGDNDIYQDIKVNNSLIPKTLLRLFIPKLRKGNDCSCGREIFYNDA